MSSNIVDEEWEAFLNNTTDDTVATKQYNDSNNINNDNLNLPKCDDLYISTTTKVLFLNMPIDIGKIFWDIAIIDYWKPLAGVIKKQMKIVSNTVEEYDNYTKKLQYINYYNEHVIKRIDNPTARRNKFKDERKITIGISKKDIMNCRGKVKNAFYNCFALILRFIYNDKFHEIHVKIFNTGKMEIPGILNETLLNNTKTMILSILRPIISNTVDFVENNEENNVLINSNFNCGFYINRDSLYSILRTKYNIESAYDPCSYPGVKCKFYFNHDYGFEKNKQQGIITNNDSNQKMSELNENKKYTEISFMIFRTGSCLIVGNCTEKILRFVYDFIKNILQSEYTKIFTQSEIQVVKPKQTKIRKKTIIVTNDVFKSLII
jgi:TATA-box binding protein (TBP) (component of TFIID and TFIIIB)